MPCKSIFDDPKIRDAYQKQIDALTPSDYKNPEPFFSIVMPSFLGDYQNAAKNRDAKIHRAIYSVLHQSFTDVELVVVADGCEQTRTIMEKHYPQVKMVFIAKQPWLSGEPRNTGISNANGKHIGYCDTDDALGKDHLQIIYDQMQAQKPAEWYFFNDWTGEPMNPTRFYNRYCSPRLKGQCGTSNIIHRRLGSPFWGSGYEHDWEFIQKLLKKSDPVYLLKSPLYYVCHIPKILDI